MMNKTSYPDWLYPDCACAESLCPICDPDFYRDLYNEMEWNTTFIPEDNPTPPF